ncbi:hypothetical protein [Xanthomonas euvesicatoria]|uniref:hypothetical protein n=1 Tax=Xanthomonas euvesicatoria TaxID=456327 RepID=UPI00146FBC48|nr:hypothetical protein [Xanthomonas euvesicatoria]QTK49883.1 hypothetical protein XeaCFBP3836p_12095 [Xanthomonas euvesicatoria pv. alfalfae]
MAETIRNATISLVPILKLPNIGEFSQEGCVGDMRYRKAMALRVPRMAIRRV